MRVRVIVADQSEARFYDLAGLDARLQPAGRLTDPDAARSQEAETPSERASGAYDRAVGGNAARRVAVTPHSTEPTPRRDAAMRFARQVAAALEAERRRDGFDRIVLMAGPAFIGLLRSALPESVRATLVAEVRKDLMRQDDSVVQAYVPPDAFS